MEESGTTAGGRGARWWRATIAVATGAMGLAALAMPDAAGVSPRTSMAAGASHTVTAAIDTSSQAAVAEAYLDRLVPALETEVGWAGDTEDCTPGAESAASRQATLDAVNFHRELAGLPPVGLSEALDDKAQRAALMMAAEDDLSHDPGPSWSCWTPTGAEAAQRSNLALGTSAAHAVRLYLLEPGDGNDEVGHRRWVLNPVADTFGTGSTDRSNAVWVEDPTPAPRPGGVTWVPWPPAGHVPWALVPTHGSSLQRFSLSNSAAPLADYDDATVEVTLDGEPLEVTIDAAGSGPGDNAIVFTASRPSGEPLPRGSATIDVTVAGIGIGGDTVSHSWTVRPFELAPPQAPPGVAIERDGGRLTVRWGAAEARGTPVTGYRVRVIGRDGAGRDVELADRDVGTATRSITVEGLSPGGAYLGQVWAESRAGVGPSSLTPVLSVPVSSDFADVPPATYYDQPVAWLDLAGITTGCAPSRFCPLEPVIRAQMAAFLWRFADQPPTGAGHRFVDVPPGTYYDGPVGWLDQEGITTGCTPARYCPGDVVTRAQMAAFLWRLSGSPPVAPSSAFADVPGAAYYAEAVAWLDRGGITTGCAPGRYCPDEPVTRAQMATFLWRLAGRP